MRYKSKGMHVPAAVETVVLEVPLHHEMRVEFIQVVNHTGNNKTVNIMWQRDGDHTHLIDDFNVDHGEYVKLLGDGSFIIMDAGDSLRIETEAGSAFDIITTYAMYSANIKGF